MARRESNTSPKPSSPMLLKTWKWRHFITCWNWGSHRSDYEDHYFHFGRNSRTFPNNLFSPGSNRKPKQVTRKNSRSAWSILLVFSLAYSSTLMMKAILPSEILKNYCTTRLYIPQNNVLFILLFVCGLFFCQMWSLEIRKNTHLKYSIWNYERESVNRSQMEVEQLYWM
jgi:hypothetical protein